MTSKRSTNNSRNVTKELMEDEAKTITTSMIKLGLSPSRKKYVICLTESLLKIMKNAFYFILKALFVLKIFKVMPRLFGHVGKTA